MEEPTRGIDVKAKVDVYRPVNECAKKGKAVCVVSSENAELMGICDRIIVLHDGEIRAVVDPKNCTQEQLTYYTHVVLCIELSISNNFFLIWDNLTTVLRQAAYVAVVACGMTFVISMGGIDLSVGAAMAMMSIIRGGAVQVIIKGIPIYGLVYPEFSFIAQGSVLGIPFPIILTIIVFAIFYYVMYHTRFGRYAISIGSNTESARLVGIPIKRIKISVYALCSFLAVNTYWHQVVIGAIVLLAVGTDIFSSRANRSK